MGCMYNCICIAGDRARRSAKQQPSSAATACGQHCATARPENLCRARHVGHREEGLEDENVHVRFDVDNPEARQHHGILLQTPRCLLPNLAALDIIGERRRLLADDSHRVQRRCIHQLLNRPRSPRQQVAHLLEELVVRFVMHHLEQQRQLKFVMSRRRGRRRPVPMHHQRVPGVQSSSSTAGRRNVGGGAHAENI
eukprot:scaffold53716_cov67-Phaeocystis_antarctica.AAC.4